MEMAGYTGVERATLTQSARIFAAHAGIAPDATLAGCYFEVRASAGLASTSQTRATALSASVVDPATFRSGREFAAYLGLVPRQNSSGGKERLGRISKMGNGYLRKLLVVGATSVIRRARASTSPSAAWAKALLERRPARVVTVAQANKTARIAWAVLARGDVYRMQAAA